MTRCRPSESLVRVIAQVAALGIADVAEPSSEAGERSPNDALLGVCCFWLLWITLAFLDILFGVDPFRNVWKLFEKDVEQMWDWRVNMFPLDRAALPAVEQITPLLRQQLRTLASTSPPEQAWRETALVEGQTLPTAPFLPPMRPGTRFTLVLDLDETLVHFVQGEEPPELPHMYIYLENDFRPCGYVNVRPHVGEVLSLIAQWEQCEVVVFTAGTQDYADAILNIMDPGQTVIHHRLYRQHCVQSGQAFFKDLCALGRPMDRVVLVDNSPVSLAMNPCNGIPIKAWRKDPHDREMWHLFELLQGLLSSDAPVQSVLEDRYHLPAFFESLRNAPGRLGAVVPEA